MAGGTPGRAALVVILVAGTALAPLPATGQEATWTRQFGTRSFDRAEGVAVDSAGNACVVGQTMGTLPGQASAGTIDAFVRTYDPAGTELWTRQFGSGGGEGAMGVAVDGAGNAYVVGYTGGALPGQASAGSFDAFVRKYDPTGTELWTRQFGGRGGEAALGVVADAAGNTHVVGNTDEALPGQEPLGGFDAFARKYDLAGNELWTRQFGSSASDFALAVAVDGTGAAYVVGSTDGTLGAQASAGSTDAFVRKYDPAGIDLWTRQFGGSLVDEAFGVAMDGAGAYVVGSADGTLPGQGPAGRLDAFVRRYDPAGIDRWTRQFGSGERDAAYGVAVNRAGAAYVVGSTNGVLPGQTSAGGLDAFTVKLA